MRKTIITFAFLLSCMTGFCQLQSSPPISLLEIRDMRGGEGSTSLEKEAELWYAKTGKEKFNLSANSSIYLSAWSGEDYKSHEDNKIKKAIIAFCLLLLSIMAGMGILTLNVNKK